MATENETSLEKLLSKINTRLTYITNNTENAFILKEVKIITTKMEYFAAKTYKEVKTVEDACNKIISYDIGNMKGVAGQTTMVYKKMDELAEFVEQLKTVYFEAEDGFKLDA